MNAKIAKINSTRKFVGLHFTVYNAKKNFKMFDRSKRGPDLTLNIC